MKKNFLKGAMLALTVMLGLMFTNLSASNLPECEKLSEMLKEEYLKTSKPYNDSGSIRIIGLQEHDALGRALNVCVRAGAKRISSDSVDLVYQLPGESGRIIVREVEGDENLFIRLIFETECKNLPFYELRFVSLRYYNSR